MSDTAERLTEIRGRMGDAAARSGHGVPEVDLCAVAKTATAKTLEEAWEAGQRLFGHNRVQALEEHRKVLPAAEWHLLGPLQGRKVKKGLMAASCYQALGETKTLERCEKSLTEADVLGYPVLLQINLNPEDERYGCPLEEMDALVAAVIASPHLDCAGLMTLALAEASESKLRADFALLYEHFKRLQKLGQLSPSAKLSMGMSQDFEIAIEEGANLVRVGRAIFPPVL